MEITMLTTQEVAEILHCSAHHVGHLRKHGLIRGTRFAKYWMYSKDDIDAFVENSLGKDYWNFKEMTPEAAQKKYLVK